MFRQMRNKRNAQTRVHRFVMQIDAPLFFAPGVMKKYGVSTVFKQLPEFFLLLP